MRVIFLTLLGVAFSTICKCQVKPIEHKVYQYKISGSGADTIDRNITRILEKVNDAVGNIHSGEYNLHDTYVLLNVGEDTTIRKESISYHLYKKIAADILIGYNIACVTPNNEQIYDGTFLYENSYKKLTVINALKFPAQIKRYSSSLAFMPFMQEVNNMMQNYKTHNNPVALIGYEFVEGEKCFKVQLGNTTDPSYVQYYISTVSYLPIKSTIILTHIDNMAKRIQTFNDWITDVKINPEINDDRFSKSALSAYYKEAQFTGELDKPANLLPLGSIAPNWELRALNGKSINLSGLAGKIVIMDFWFKACVPCQQQMVDLEKLYANYDKSKVVFIGINTVDDPIKDKLTLFLNNRKITMPTVYNGKKIESLYHAYSCPALYIINKDGKILYTQDGFSDAMIDNVSKTIAQHL